MLKKKTQKRIIEVGMLGSMAGMIGTGIQGSKKPHIVTSVAFVVFTALHYNHFRPVFKKRKKAASR